MRREATRGVVGELMLGIDNLARAVECVGSFARPKCVIANGMARYAELDSDFRVAESCGGEQERNKKRSSIMINDKGVSAYHADLLC